VNLPNFRGGEQAIVESLSLLRGFRSSTDLNGCVKEEQDAWEEGKSGKKSTKKEGTYEHQALAKRVVDPHACFWRLVGLMLQCRMCVCVYLCIEDNIAGTDSGTTGTSS
jgi:hypothetical protein